MPPAHQILPSDWAQREVLRNKGQFWTPSWVAEAMVAYAIAGGSDHLFDPAVGEGAFLRAAKAQARRLGRPVRLLGTEIDPDAIRQARGQGLEEGDLTGVELRDFVRNPPERQFAAIVANPPYIRHHRLPQEVKQHLKALSERTLGRPLDGRAGLHAYFLLQALRLLQPGGRLAFLLPADVCEGIYAPPLWNWIAKHYCLDAVITFAPEAAPFPNVDTNALILLLRAEPPVETFAWARARTAGTDALTRWVLEGETPDTSGEIETTTRALAEGIATGLSRAPAQEAQDGPVLGDFCAVMRGIATGDNAFFFLTRAQAERLCLPQALLLPAVGRARDIETDTITLDTLVGLEARGRPTLLFAPDARPLEAFAPPVQDYLREGARRGLPDRALIRQRKPWYRMERRRVPPFLFAYLGRRNARFLRNQAGVLPLTGFLCVYPRAEAPEEVEKIWQLLRHPATIANLGRVGKSYGSGAIKVEPRALERLPLPADVADALGLACPRLRL